MKSLIAVGILSTLALSAGADPCHSRGRHHGWRNQQRRYVRQNHWNNCNNNNYSRAVYQNGYYNNNYNPGYYNNGYYAQPYQQPYYAPVVQAPIYNSRGPVWGVTISSGCR